MSGSVSASQIRDTPKISPTVAAGISSTSVEYLSRKRLTAVKRNEDERAGAAYAKST